MCGGSAWDDEGWRPFAASTVDADEPLVREAHKRSGSPGVPLS
jgi:hypothetical protein